MQREQHVQRPLGTRDEPKKARQRPHPAGTGFTGGLSFAQGLIVGQEELSPES